MYLHEVPTRHPNSWSSVLGEESFDWDELDSISMVDYPHTPQGQTHPTSSREHAIDDWSGRLRLNLHQKLVSSKDYSNQRSGFAAPQKLTPEKDDPSSGVGMYSSIYSDQPSPRRGSLGRSPLKANHELAMSFPDSDSGFSSSLRTRSGVYGRTPLTEDLFSPVPQGRLMKSRSLSRIGDAFDQDPVLFSPRSVDTGYKRQDLTGYDRTTKDLKDKLQDSENRRTVLMSKLKEAQQTLQAQGDRLDRIENTAKGNEYVVESLKIKEQEYRQKIGNLERDQDEKDFLRLENMRLREDMQNRISTLGYQLKSLQSQYSTTETESQKRNSLLEQTSKALNLLEEENAKFQKERDSAVVEMKATQDSYQITQTKFALMEEENKLIKADFKKLSQEYDVCERKMCGYSNKSQDLEGLVHTLRNENERLAAAWETTTEEKQKLCQQKEKFDEILSELKSQLSVANTDKEKSLQDKLELQTQLQQLVVDKEHLMKSKISLEEQVNEHQREITQVRINCNRGEEGKRRLEEELKAVKKVSEELSTELSSSKSAFERSLEQVTILESRKKISSQQNQILEQENRRLEMELQKTKDGLLSKEADIKAERSQLEESIQKYKDEARVLRVDKGQSEDKCRELETKLKRANEELHHNISLQQSELESWKSTCERLTGSVSRKEAELQSLTDKCGDLEDVVSKLKKESKIYEEQLEQCLDAEDISDRLQEDNRRLLQEKAENEQMIQLLEMQKEVLSKSSESNLDRLHEVDQLMERMDQLRNENTLLRDRIVELERLRDSLRKQTDEAVKTSFLPSQTDLSQLKVYQDQNDQLQHVNQVLTKKMDKLEQENSALKLRSNISMETVPKTDLNRLERQKKLIEEEHCILQQQHQELTDRHQRFVINYRHDNNTGDKSDYQSVLKEKRVLEKQVAYLQGQIILIESSKKRSEEASKELEEQVRLLEEQDSQLISQDTTQEVNDLQKSLKESKKKRENLETLVRTLRQQLLQEKKKVSPDVTDGDLSELKEEIEKLTDVLNTKDEKIEQLDTQLGQLKKQLCNERQTKSMPITDLGKESCATDSKQLPGNRANGLSQPLSVPGKSLASNGDQSVSRPRKTGPPAVAPKPKRPDFSEPEVLEAQAHATSEVFKPPSRNVHPRLQTLMERYNDNSEDPLENLNKGDNQNKEDNQNKSPVMGSRWPYNKLSSGSKSNKLGQKSQAHLYSNELSEGHIYSSPQNSMGNGSLHSDTASSNGEVSKDEEQRKSLMDSQEQRDISSLIQKYLNVLEM